MESLIAGSETASIGAASQTPELRTSCQHSEKYEISTNGEPVSQFPYPSRLGFLNFAASGVSIRYVDLNKKLCRACCDEIVPGGKYYAWSILAGTVAGDVSAVLAKLTPSDVFYPPILQAGSESEAAVHPIPDIPGAKEVWQWLEAQGKPFYIDQLHLPVGRGLTPLARKRVAKDSAVALRYGQVVTLDLIQQSSELKPEKVVASKGKSEPRMNTKTASEKRSSKKTSANESRKDSTGAGASKIDLLPKETLDNKSGAKSVIEQLEPTTHGPKTVKPLRGKSSTKKSTARDPRPEAIPAPKNESTEEKLNSSSSVSLTVAAVTESQKLTSTPSISMTTSAATKAFTRSWGWSEPFEFTTIRRKMPALSDYERVAEARVPKIPETKSLAHFVQKRLELEPAPKLRGPGDIDEVTEAALGKLLSTQMKDSLSSSPKKSKTRSSITNDEELSAKKCSKALDASSSKSKSLGNDTKLSSSSKDTKLVKTPEKSGKASKEISSQHGKHQQSQTSSSRVTHLVDGKVKTKKISTHDIKSAKSESKTSEVHARSVKTKETSQGPGSVAGLLRAGLNYAEHKISDAANKPADGKKHKRRKSSESKPRPHIKPDHGDPDQTGPESSAHTNGKPPKPDQTEQSESGQPSTQTDPSINGQPASQMDVPAQSGPTTITDTPGPAEPLEQNPISVQGNTPALANESPQSVPQLSSGAGNLPGGYSNTSEHSQNLPSMSAGESSVQGGTAQHNDANGDHSKPAWAEGYSSMDSVSQPFQSVHPAAEGHGSSDISYGPNSLPNDTGVSTSVEGAIRIDLNSSTGEIPGTAERDHGTRGSGPVAAKDSGKGEASSYYDPKLDFTSSTAAGVNGPDHTRIPDADGKKIGAQAARQKHDQGKHKVNSHDGKRNLAKPSHGGSRKHNGRTSGTTAGLAGLAVGATVGYVAAEMLKEESSDSGSGSDSDSKSDSDNDTPSQYGNSDHSDSGSEDGVASESGEGELDSDSDAESDQDENAEVPGTDSDSDADDNYIDDPTANELSDGDLSDEEQDDDHDGDHSTEDELSDNDLSDADQDDEDDDEGSEVSQNEVSSENEEASDEDTTQQDSSGPEDDSSGSEESSVEGNDTASEDEDSDIEENEQSDPEVSEPEDFDSE